MGNVGSNSSSGRNRRRRSRRNNQNPPTTPQPENPSSVRHVAVPAAQQYYHQYPAPLPAPYDHHHYRGVGGHVAGEGGGHVAPTPYVEHEKAVTIRNDVNVKRESLRVDADVDNPGMFLVSFTFDATVSGCITIMFFAKEGDECELEPTKPDQVLEPITMRFEQGLGQRFVQRAGTGFDPSLFEESELAGKEKEDKDAEKVYPLAVKAGTETNSQVTLAIFERERGAIRARVWKQILWVKGMRYELQEIYGIANSGDMDVNDPGKDCVICLSEPRDTTVLPCRHMCLCNGCAKVLRFQTNRCPICRQPVERLLEIRLNNNNE